MTISLLTEPRSCERKVRLEYNTTNIILQNTIVIKSRSVGLAMLLIEPEISYVIKVHFFSIFRCLCVHDLSIHLRILPNTIRVTEV
jgi:hypothetical protein